jgi:AraC-like DNA-binding protein
MNEILSSISINGIHIERVVRDSSFTMSTKHFHDDYELYYLLDGNRYYFIEDCSYLVEPGSLVLIDQQQIHKTSPSTTPYHERILISFEPNSFLPLSAVTTEIDLPTFFKKYKGLVTLHDYEKLHIEALFMRIFSEFLQKQVHYEAQILLTLSELLLYIARIFPSHASQNPIHSHSLKHVKVNEISDFIASHYRSSLSLNVLAEHFYLNKSYLSRIFKEISGFNVNEYINIIKIQRAKDLLITTQDSISEIAQHLGYTSLTYFERMFKQYTDITPLRYRKKMQHPH